MSQAYVAKWLRDRISAAARYRCGYCLSAERVVGARMEIDHLVPKALGGLTVEENLWLACSLCNDHKADRIAFVDSLTGDLVPLFNPRIPGLDGPFSLGGYGRIHRWSHRHRACNGRGA
ncbi:MAG: HNH endonuclease signature motif containing protein [Planctomycetota bacterium]|nr:HNH endonuclease signature motif containing protein [Planctomycetota bacterium]